MALRKKKRSPILLISVGAHVALALGIAFIPQQKLREVVAIAMAETNKKDEPKPPPPRNDPPRQARASRSVNAAPRAPAAAPMPAAAPVPGAANFQDIGLSLDSSSADGLAIPMAQPTAEKAIAVTNLGPKKPKVLVSKPLEQQCTEEIVKPIPDVVVRPDYTQAARDARVEGRVRVELMIDENGTVTSARVLNGLGYGLDEAAIEAVKKMRFRPGTLCSKPVATPFIMAVRFLLGS